MDLDFSSLSSADTTSIVTCDVEGLLEPDDLRFLAEGKAAPNTAPSHVRETVVPQVDDPTDLKKVREKHHSVARLIATGMTQRMVATICGYTESYLSILLNNPSMRELIEHYRIGEGKVAEVVGEKLRTLAGKATEQLEERLDAGQLDNNQLLGVAKLGYDRAGHGPAQRLHIKSESHIIDHAQLQELNRAARAEGAERIVPIAEARRALPSPATDAEAE